MWGMAGLASYTEPLPSSPAERSKPLEYYGKSEFCVVREQPEGREAAKCYLERALEKQYKIVIIEAQWQGENAIKWIRFGNFLHKISVLSCFGGLVLLPLLPNRLFGYVVLPLGCLGIGCAGLYDISWQFDPCCKYQIDHQGYELTHIPSHELHTPSPVVLIFRNDKYRKRLHNLLALAMCAMLGWRLYKLLYN